MRLALRAYFLLVLASMLGVTAWAGSQVPLWQLPASLTGHPWFIATLVDTYWAFFAFCLWVWYKEPGWAARILWFLAIVLLGNIAMAVYALGVLAGLPADARAEQVLLRGRALPGLLPLGLLGALAGFTALAVVL